MDEYSGMEKPMIPVTIEGRMTIPPLEERLNEEEKQLLQRISDIRQAREILKNNPDVNRLLNIMSRNRGLFRD